MNQEIDTRSADSIITDLQRLAEDKHYVLDRKEWLNAAFLLNSFRFNEEKIFNGMRQEVSQLKLDTLKSDEKKSVAKVEIEVEASDLYRLMKDQEAKIAVIKEYGMIAKKAADDF